MSLSTQALRLLSREINTLQSDPPEGVRIIVDEEDLTCLEGIVQGPVGTPYEGGYFRIKFNFTPEYPNVPPKCTMMTKIFHPNVSKAGEICVDTLKKGWKREYGVGHVLVTIKCLLIYPNPESALDEEAGKQLLVDYEGYCKYARLITSIHATPKTVPQEFRSTTTSSSRPSSISTVSTENTLSTSHAVSSSSKAAAIASTSTSASLTAGQARPAPLSQNIRQEQSPAVASDAVLEGTPLEERALKPLAVTPAPAGAKTGVKKAGAGGAKRGLKRL